MGKRQHRANRALEMEYLTDKSRDEIADELGVAKSTVSNYIHNTDWGEEVKEQIEKEKSRVLKVSIEELKRQLKEASSTARSAEKPQAIYTDEDGDLVVEGEGDDMHLVQTDIELMPDGQTRYFRRSEVREILKEMRELLGVDAVEKVEVEHSGEIGHSWSDDELEQLDDVFGVDE